jgi:hypothetical protein
VNKSINKIEKEDSSTYNHEEATSQSDNYKYFLDKNGKLQERKKKGRLYSLGGNEPPQKFGKARLDRLQTVGTFDMGCDMLGNLNEKIICAGFKFKFSLFDSNTLQCL